MTQAVDVQALDISNCGLSDLALRDIFEVLHHQGRSLQWLDVSGNRGRVQASVGASLAEVILDLRKLDVSGIIMGDIPGPVFSVDTLLRFQYLEELDLSKFKVSPASRIRWNLPPKQMPKRSSTHKSFADQRSNSVRAGDVALSAAQGSFATAGAEQLRNQWPRGCSFDSCAWQS